MIEYKGINLSVDKSIDKNTTSHQFKKDLIDEFKDSEWNNTILEVSCNRGYTTSVLSKIFGRVYAVEVEDRHLRKAKSYNKFRTNIHYIKSHVYVGDKWEKFPMVDVVFIDCVHVHEFVLSDLEESIKHINNQNGFIILDDYGLYRQVKLAVKDFIEKMNGEVTIHKYIGEPEGSTIRKGKVMDDYEGVILKYKKNEEN
tara:strand:+ start:218 stop:814 length:597 start_codon:yes stop_codon:yes gene_type:complete